ncbi:multi-sensor signal transduction histidine kinase [Catenovulum agarivorans DS-2]|uniref:histidine kinase n=1 Tax=Catenovulum agarivorans DS-2 TaxID=1328313 RepID=W7QWI5_9ALTE|nr:PAS domain-containing sensor histidine kinase [Catenovulum agarivorans]EWH09625.1 multi-sensor signal transduction histidine kinase [Catenovulum agarivorans DS-2]
MPWSIMLVVALIVFLFVIANWLVWHVRIKPLKQFEKLTQSLLQTLSQDDGQIWILNLKTQYLYYYHPNTLELTEITLLDWDNPQHLQTWLHRDDIEKVREKFKDFLNNRNQAFTAEFRLMTGKGSFRWVQLKGQCLDNSRNDIYMYGLLQNIENLVATKNELAQSQSKLIETQSELDQTSDLTQDALSEVATYQEELLAHRQMVDIAERVPEFAHEINTPIGICVTATSHMQEAMLSINNKISSNTLSKKALEKYQDETSNTLKLMQQNIERAADLIQSFKQITADQTSEQQRHFNLNVLINDTLNTLRPKLKNSPHTIELNTSETIEMYSYPGPLSQILINLINNSLTHAFTDLDTGTIKISTFDYTTGDPSVLIIYADNGVGVTAEQLEKLFTPYYTTNRENGNTGLGMAICKNMVEKLGGEIVINSQKHSGFEAYIRLPIELDNIS